MLDTEWGVCSEIVAFSEFYNVRIQVFDSFGSWELITRISTSIGKNIISMLFSEVHYDNLTPKNNENDFILN